MNKPLCFVIMPFEIKKDSKGNEIDFDEVYNSLIKPAIKAADMAPIRADEETVNGIIHNPMYERLILCDYAIADLTTANANVLYELGIRHAVKPYTTITINSSNSVPPFNVNSLRCMPYNYDTHNKLISANEDIKKLTNKLLLAKKEKTTDSPVYQLVSGITFQNSLAHEKTDIFRNRVSYNKTVKKKLTIAREKEGDMGVRIEAIKDIVNTLKLENEETGVLIDIMLSYRAISAYTEMVEFIEIMPSHVKQTVMVQEQLGFALNRLGEHDQAIQVLEKVIEENGPSSETYGILGRVYKDQFDKARGDKNELLAESKLDIALESYIRGFEADWRDAYPGVNAVTILELQGKRSDIDKLIHVVRYAVERKIATKKPDYWDYATFLELAIIENNALEARKNLKQAIGCPIEGDWMYDTTIKNINLILSFRKKRDEDCELPQEIIELLQIQKDAYLKKRK